MENNEFEYKKSYTGIFGLNYFTQGIYTSIFTMVIPVYLLITYGSINIAALAFMLSIILIPTTIKIVYGIITDKVGIRNLGRRKPWIIFPVSVGGIVWIIITFMIPSTSDAAIRLFTVAGLITSFCVYFSDTALDGFILDICPKSELGRTQGFCWGLRAAGIIFGGPVILLFLVYIPIEIIFISFGIMMITFSLFTLFIKDIKKHKTINIGATIKEIFKKSENWKLFVYSFFLQIVGGVVYTFLALYILIKMGLVKQVGASTGALGDVSIYESQAFITAIISIGIITGSLLGGIIADKKSRRLAVILGLSLYVTSLLLLILPVPISILIVFAFLVGAASAWYWAAYSAIAGEYSKKYPEMASTFFSICLSFINLGTIIGLIITGIWFNIISKGTTDALIIFGTLFILMAVLEAFSIIPFLMLDRKNYEYKLAEK